MRITKMAWVGTRTDNAKPTVAFCRDVLDAVAERQPAAIPTLPSL